MRAITSSRGGLVAAVAAVALAAPAFGAEAPAQSEPAAIPLTGLLAHLPAGAEVVTLADIDRARQATGVSAKAGIFSTRPPQSADLSLFYGAAATGIADFDQPVRSPLLRVLVQDDVSAAATALSPDGEATVIATTQSGSSLLSRLRTGGYRQRGHGVWLAPSSFPASRLEYVAIYDGGIIEASRPALVAALAAQTTMPPSDEPIAVQVHAVGDAPSVGIIVVKRSCISSVAITDRLSPHSGQLRLATHGAPNPSRLRPGRLEPAFSSSPQVGHVTTSGQALVAPLTAAHLPANALPSPFTETIGELTPEDLYRCG